MVIEELKDAFWEAVVDCLVQFHDFSRTDARAQASDLRGTSGCWVIDSSPGSSIMTNRSISRGVWRDANWICSTTRRNTTQSGPGGWEAGPYWTLRD